MIHPDTVIRFLGPDIGHGVLARQPIPAGTLVWVRDALEIEIPATSPLTDDPLYAEALAAHAFTLPNGNRLVHWDHAKLINHSCDSSCLCTGWTDVMIAVRDIGVDEEITDDYGLYFADYEKPMECRCGSKSCRGVISPADFDARVAIFDARIAAALPRFTAVEQPLLPYLTPRTLDELTRFAETETGYRSVARWRFQ